MNKKLKLGIIIALTVILVLLGLVGCTSQTPARGWAGVAAIGDTLIFSNMAGSIYSIDGSTNAVIGAPVKFTEIVAAGGFLGLSCSGPTSKAIPVYAAPAINGDTVIFGGFNGKVYAYPILDGALREQYRWRYPPQDNTTVGGNIVGGVAVAGDKVFFTSVNGTVFALNAAEGYKVWSVELGNKVWSSPAVDNDTVYIGCFDKKMYALNAADGTVKWQLPVEGAISTTPIIDNGVLYFGDYSRAFYAVNTTNGQLIWKFPATVDDANAPGNWFWAKAVLHNGIIYAPNLDGKVYAIDAGNGTLKQTFSFETTTFKNPAISSSPVLVGDTIVVGITDLAKNVSRVYAIDTPDRTRELASFTEGIDASLFAYNGKVYLHTTKDNFYTVDPQTGVMQQISLTAGTSK